MRILKYLQWSNNINLPKIIIMNTRNSHLDIEDVSILPVKHMALGTLNKQNLHHNMKFYCVANNIWQGLQFQECAYLNEV
jgi:hypothetical protein